MTRRSETARPIYLWWIGADVPPDSALKGVANHVERVFGLVVQPWRGPERPTHAFDPARGQALSSRILEWLLRAGPEDGRKIVAVTDMDLLGGGRSTVDPTSLPTSR